MGVEAFLVEEHRTIEVKARARDLRSIEERLLSWGAVRAGSFRQIDHYFQVPRGRLKLREIEGSDEVELIYYERADEARPRPCESTIIRLKKADAEPLKRILPLRGVVKKRRTIYRLGQAELHLDEVEGIGPIIEVEVRLGEGLDERGAMELAKKVLRELGVREEDLIPYSNIDIVARSDGLKVLWAPWRMTYIVRAHERRGCLFCELKEEGRDEENKVLYRGRTCYIVLNIYPYNTGHVMVAPYRHVADPTELTDEEMLDLWRTVNLAIRAIRLVYRPHGFNIGINLGRIAGAGVEEHLHVHIVPRWAGDTNFMPVIASTKVISQHIDEMYRVLREAFEALEKPSEEA